MGARVNMIQICENGPLDIRADIALAGHERVSHAALCRCGASRTKPFCDGSHVTVGFQATGEPKSRTGMDLQERSGELKIVPMFDGPLAIKGPFEIVSGTGRTLLCGIRVALCRCGQSRTKPYCDGQHVMAKFKSG